MEFIKKKQEIQLIFEKGHSNYGKYLVVYFLRNSLNINRFGICVGKKLGSAVRRNYLKRLLREAARKINLNQSGWDIILVAQKRILSATLDSIIEDIQHIFFKADLLTLKSGENTEDSQ